MEDIKYISIESERYPRLGGNCCLHFYTTHRIPAKYALDGNVRIRIPVTIEFASSDVFAKQDCGLRSSPVSRITDMLELRLNDCHPVKMHLADMLDPVARYTLSQKDRCSSTQGEPVKIISRSPAKIETDIVEELCLFTCDNGLVREFSAKFTITTELCRIWSREAEVKKVTIGKARMTFRCVRCNFAPRTCTLRNTTLWLARHAECVEPNCAIRLSRCAMRLEHPKELFIFAKAQRGKVDTYFALESITIRWNYDNAAHYTSKENLFDIAKRNGCKMTWLEWSGLSSQGIGAPKETVGSVLKVECAAHKVRCLDIEAIVKNVNQTRALVPELHIIAVADVKIML